MPVSLNDCTFQITGRAGLTDTGSIIWTPSGAVQIGAGEFAAILSVLTDGTGDEQANQMFVSRLTVPAGTALELNLCDGSLTNFIGEPIAFTAIKLAIFSVVDPASGKRVYVGPLGATDGARLWFTAAGATDGLDAGEEVVVGTVHIHPYSGWAVGPTIGEETLRIEQPDATGGDVEVNVILIGVE